MTSRNSVSRSEVLEILQELIRTPSVNPRIAPDEACGEVAIANVARQWLEAKGIKSWLEEAAPGRPNAVADVGGGTGGTVVFCAHLDKDFDKARQCYAKAQQFGYPERYFREVLFICDEYQHFATVGESEPTW